MAVRRAASPSLRNEVNPYHPTAMFARDLIDDARLLAAIEVTVADGVSVDRLEVTGLSTDERAGPGDLAWISDATLRTAAERVSAFQGAVLIAPPTAGELGTSSVLICTPSPKTLFSQLLARHFAHLSELKWPGAATHISDDARIGNRVQLGPGVVIGPRVVLGDDVTIGPNTCLANTTIASNVTIGCNCSIGLAGFGYSQSEAGEWLRFPHTGGVRIESDVEIGSNTCIDRGTLGDTVIRQGTKIDNLVHVAHNCEIGPSALLIANCMIGGSTVVGAHAWVAPSSAINNKLAVGEHAIIGTGAVVIRNVPPSTTVVGNPAKPLNR